MISKNIFYTELYESSLTIHELFLTEYEFSGFFVTVHGSEVHRSEVGGKPTIFEPLNPDMGILAETFTA